MSRLPARSFERPGFSVMMLSEGLTCLNKASRGTVFIQSQVGVSLDRMTVLFSARGQFILYHRITLPTSRQQLLLSLPDEGGVKPWAQPLLSPMHVPFRLLHGPYWRDIYFQTRHMLPEAAPTRILIAKPTYSDSVSV